MQNRIFVNKLVKIIITVCALAALCFALIACDNGESPVDNTRTFEESWMSYISDEALVSNTVMPGSHDAGTFGADKAWATQHSTIEQQLYDGVRYFDCRSTYKIQTTEYYFIHADSNMPVFPGSEGQPVKESLEAVKNFIQRNTQEVLVLDFQHIWNSTEEGLIELISNTLPMDKVLNKNDVKDPSSVTFGKMRELGKNIIVIYNDTYSDMCEETDWLFARSEYLQSDYVGNIHRSNTDALKAQWENYFADKKDGVFFVLQGQMTGSPLEGREALIRPVLNDYLKNTVAKDATKLAAVNIVMKDFIADDVAECDITSKAAIQTILSLNIDKGTVKADKLEDFKKGCGIA